jgi:hypothetical protein
MDDGHSGRSGAGRTCAANRRLRQAAQDAHYSAGASRQPPVRQREKTALGDGLPTSPTVRPLPLGFPLSRRRAQLAVGTLIDDQTTAAT